MHVSKILISVFFLTFFYSCASNKKTTTVSRELSFVNENLKVATLMLNSQLQEANRKFDAKNGAYPRTFDSKGNFITTSIYDWTPGFFPGSLWYAYQFSKDENLKAEALKWTEKLLPLQHFTQHHDLGFMMYCSYGNAYRLAPNEAYKKILINSAKALCTRFNETAGVIKSWNSFKSWHGNATYYYPVIIDNMMNLEMLFFASRISGDTSFRHVAFTHAMTTLKNHFRSDHGSYHVVCYDSTNGKVVARETAQGYADNSTWARGQAWAVYGYTMSYRETKDVRFLKLATELADYFIQNKNLPSDGVPYWDFNVNEPGFTPGKNSNANKVQQKYRDASAAAITASALIELSTYVDKKLSEKYRDAGVNMLKTLSSAAYKAVPGSNGNFILKHSVGSIPHNVEIDVPLVYADYYYVEALLRYQLLLQGKALFNEEGLLN